MKKKILFVDDDQFVLQAIRRLLRNQKDNWECHFANSGGDALEILENETFEVICSDMRMPQMNGAELLGKVRELYPRMIRIILSAQCDQESVLKLLGPAHQYLTKPCDVIQLLSSINQCNQTLDKIENEQVASIVGQADSLPSLPGSVHQLIAMLQDPDSSLNEIGSAIEADVALSAKVLQLANSPFFGVQREILTPKHAVSILGKNQLRPIVLSASVFNHLDSGNISGAFNLDAFTKRAICSGKSSELLAYHLSRDLETASLAMVAGLLHDVGMLLLFDRHPQMINQAIDSARRAEKPLWEMEQVNYGTTHAEIGGHLLGNWGFPCSIVEAIAFHHHPGQRTHQDRLITEAVHVACTWSELRFESFESPFPKYDVSILEPEKLDECLAEIESGMGQFAAACS